MVSKAMETKSCNCPWLKLAASPNKKSASETPGPFCPPELGAVAVPSNLYVPAVSTKIFWFLCPCNHAPPNLKLCAPRVHERSSFPWLLLHVFVHGQFPLSIFTLYGLPTRSIPGILLIVFAPLKIGVVTKSLGVFHNPVFAIVMLLPFSLNAASFSRLGRRFIVKIGRAHV